MKRAIIQCLRVATITFFALLPAMTHAEVTLEYCLERAATNYPLVKRYSLLEKTADINLSDINKSWLPTIGIYGQATAQNAVPQFPETLKNVLTQMGQESKGLSRLQYKLGLDLTQIIWDGGASKSRREIERASLAENQAGLDVGMYAVREKVTDLFFSILLMQEQISQSRNNLSLLEANLSMMKKMLAGGVAMQTDVDMIEAEMLTVSQQIDGAESALKGYRDLLSLYIGEELGDSRLAVPSATIPGNMDSARPELSLYDKQKQLNAARQSAVSATLMPKIGFFAQTYYGYPGFNYFESMMRRNLSFNLLAGVKISWNIDSFYTQRNSRNRLLLADEGIDNDKETFLFNSKLQTSAQTQEIEGMRTVMQNDQRIVTLRTNVRRSAESQLKNGVIDATTLLTKITEENQARLNARYHEIQLLQAIYKLKNTLNR